MERLRSGGKDKGGMKEGVLPNWGRPQCGDRKVGDRKEVEPQKPTLLRNVIKDLTLLHADKNQ